MKTSMSPKRHNDQRARSHPAYWAFLVHRLSGLALALFLPLHFWALGSAIQGEALLDGFAVFYQTIPLHRGADLPLLGITLFLAGMLFIIRVLSVSP